MSRIASLEEVAISHTCVIQGVLGLGEASVELVESYAYRDSGLVQMETDLF